MTNPTDENLKVPDLCQNEDTKIGANVTMQPSVVDTITDMPHSSQMDGSKEETKRNCQHPPDRVTADILEGDYNFGWSGIRWCQICGAYQRWFKNGMNAWTLPTALDKAGEDLSDGMIGAIISYKEQIIVLQSQLTAALKRVEEGEKLAKYIETVGGFGYELHGMARAFLQRKEGV